MKPIKVEFLNIPKVIPKTIYKRCIFTFWILKCAYPNYMLESDMQVILTFDNGQKFLLIIMAIIISGNGIDMGGNPVSNASQIDSTVINENGVKVTSDVFNNQLKEPYLQK